MPIGKGRKAYFYGLCSRDWQEKQYSKQPEPV